MSLDNCWQNLETGDNNWTVLLNRLDRIAGWRHSSNVLYIYKEELRSLVKGRGILKGFYKTKPVHGNLSVILSFVVKKGVGS